MIRWTYVLPRLLVLATAALLLLVAVNPAVRWSVICSGQRLTGAKVEIGRVETSYRDTTLVLHDFCAADPQRPMKNLFEADRIALRMDPALLSRKKIVVERGVIDGLRFGTDRQSSGALSAEQRAKHHAALAEKFAQFGEPFFDHAARALEEDFEQNFQSVQLARELSERWPREYQQLSERGAQIESQIHQLRQRLQEIGDNPLRNAQLYQQSVADLETLHQQLDDVRNEIARLGRQLEDDEQALADAKRHDEQVIRSRLQLRSLDAQQLTEYFLGPELSHRMIAVVEWLQWGRRRLPSRNPSAPSGARGTDIVFAGITPVPDVLLKTLVLNGEGSFGGQPMTLQGVVKRLSSDPEMLSEPTEVTIQTVGGLSMLVHAVLDTRGELRHDEVRIDIPQMALPQSVLGRPDRLALSVAPGQARLSMRVELTGNDLLGELVVRQQRPELTAVMPPDRAGIAQLVSESVAQIDELEARALLSGTIHAPQWKLQSNLGPELAAALNQRVYARIEERRTAALRVAHEEVDRAWQAIEVAFAEQTAHALEALRVSDAAVVQVRDSVTSRLGLVDDALRQSPVLRDVLRR